MRSMRTQHYSQQAYWYTRRRKVKQGKERVLFDASGDFWWNAVGTLATKSEAGTSSYVAQHMVLFTILLRMLCMKGRRKVK